MGVEEEMESEADGNLPPGPEPVELFPLLKMGREEAPSIPPAAPAPGAPAADPTLGVVVPDPTGEEEEEEEERALILLGG